MTYTLTSGSLVLRSDGATIPADLRNADYQQYLIWAYGQTAFNTLYGAYVGNPTATPPVAGTGNPSPSLAGLTYVNALSPYVAPPAPTPTLTFLQFMALFTSAEQAAIVSSADTQTKLFIMMATGSGGLQLTNAEVIADLNYLATPTTATPPGPGLIAASRVAQILAGTPPA